MDCFFEYAESSSKINNFYFALFIREVLSKQVNDVTLLAKALIRKSTQVDVFRLNLTFFCSDRYKCLHSFTDGHSHTN